MPLAGCPSVHCELIQSAPGAVALARRRSDTDRRAQDLALTEAGEQLTGEALQRLHAGERQTLKCLSDGEHLLLLELLRKVAAADGS